MSAVVQSLPMTVRKMRQEDVPSVMVSEEAAYSHPWTAGVLRDCLKVGYLCLVGEVHGRIMAHAVMSLAVGEAHVLNLCVHPQWQGQGYGRGLLQHLADVAERGGATHMFLEVRASNDIAQQLYLSMGFNEIAQRPAYYPAEDGREMALIYARTLVEHE